MSDKKDVLEKLEMHATKTLGELPEIKFDGKDFLATVELPFGGPLYKGERLPTVLLKGITGKGDMVLSDATSGKIAGDVALDRLLLESIAAFGNYTSRHEILEILKGRILLADYTYLLFKLRQMSLGSKYTFRIECEKCGHDARYTANMEEMGVEGLDVDHFEPITSSINVHGYVWEVTWHMMTQHDAKYLFDVDKQLREESRTKAAAVDRKRHRRKEVANRQDVADPNERSLDIVTSACVARIDNITFPKLNKDDEVETVYLGRRHTGGQTDDGALVLSKLDSIDKLLTLPEAVRLLIFKEFTSYEPYFDHNVYLSCNSCGANLEFLLHPQDPAFFYPTDLEV